MHLCVCPYVCKSMEKKLRLYETPMYIRYFGYLSNIMLLYVYWGVICVSLSILVKKFQLLAKIH